MYVQHLTTVSLEPAKKHINKQTNKQKYFLFFLLRLLKVNNLFDSHNYLRGALEQLSSFSL